MTARVLEFPSPGDDQPHLSGPAHCVKCGYEWAAVAPVGTVWMDCPSCAAECGTFSGPMLEPPGGLVWHCHCGGFLFICSPDGTHCIRCGTVQVFP